MGYKLTKKNLRKIVLQEIRKLTETGYLGDPEEEENPCPEEGMVRNIDGDCVPESEGIDPVDVTRTDAGRHFPRDSVEELSGLLDWAKETQGYEPDEW